MSSDMRLVPDPKIKSLLEARATAPHSCRAASMCILSEHRHIWQERFLGMTCSQTWVTCRQTNTAVLPMHSAEWHTPVVRQVAAA